MGKVRDQAYVTLATNDAYALGAMVLGCSLRNVNTNRELAVIITPMVTQSMRNHLNSLFDYVTCVDVLESRDEANLALIRRPELGVTFTKINCWKLTQYKKCVFLDSDCLVIQNCDELFEKEELSAAPDIGWPDCFNSGVFVYTPSENTYKALLDTAITQGSFDGGDQGLLNAFFSSWATKDISKHLSFIYNMASSATYSYLSAYKRFMKDVKIIHFLGSIKPWNCSYDYSTGQVSTSGRLYRAEHLQIWWDIYMKNIHSMLDPKYKSILGSKPASHTYEEGSHSTKNLTDKERKDAWEGGKIDYLGADAFENIQKHIESQVQNINMNAYKASGKNDKNNSHVILTGYNDNNTIKNYQVKGEGLVRKGKENLGRGRLNGVAHPVNNFPPSHSFYSTDSLSDTTQPTMKNLKNSSDLENKYNNYDVYINNTSPTLTQKHLLPVNKLFITHNDSDEKAINNNNEGIHDNVNFKNISSLIFFKITPIFKNVGLKKIPILDARNNQMNILSSNEINDKNDHYIKFYDAYYPNNNGAKPDDPKMNKYTSTTKIISESGNDILDNIQIIQPDCTKHIKPTDCNVSSIHPKFSNIKVTSFGYDDHPESVTTYQVPLRPNAILNHEYNIKDDRTLLTDEKEGKSYKEYTSPHYNYESLIERQKLYETDVRRERETHKTMSQIELEKRSERDKLTVVTLSVTIRDKQGQPVTTKTISLDPIPCQPPPSIASFITNPHIISDKSYVRTRYTTLQPNVNISGRSEYRSIVELPQSSRQIKLQTETFPLSLPKIPDDHHQ
ncbi:uncharacterized protein LOC135925228 isoform X2 [Gordionus sp. m RMFG-2023]|uniref:uncharacterized protein LOC135925228 isoform X2 n=1 Tax=Gordionus sp. m RMFG-2023 TaxID=3053472 RepID=UPI0031FD567A